MSFIFGYMRLNKNGKVGLYKFKAYNKNIKI